MSGLSDFVDPETDGTDEMEGVSLDDLGGSFDSEYEEEEGFAVPPPELRPMHTSSAVRSSPLFQHADQFPAATQFRVYHLQEGQPHSVGVIAIDANESEFIGKFHSACPGKFVLRPVDELGNYLGSEFTHTVSPHHPALGASISGSSVAPLGRDPSEVLMEVMRERERQIATKEARLENELRRRDQQISMERAAIQEERADVAAERVAMASQASATTATISERQIEATRDAGREQFQAMAQLFQNTNGMMQQVMQYQSQNHEQAMERAKNDQQFALERFQQAQERERERERVRAKEGRLVAEQARENDRAHFRAVTELQQNNGTLGGAKKLLNEFGLTPADLFQALKGSDGESQSTGSTLIGVLGEVAKSFAKASGDAAKAQAEAQARQLETVAAMQQGNPQLVSHDQGGEFVDAEYLDEEEDYEDFDSPGADPQNPRGSPPEVLAAFRAEPSPVALDLGIQKKARKALRVLVHDVAGASSSDWAGIITARVVQTPEILEYVRAVTIRKALIEAGASNGLDTQIIQAIDESGLVPADILRG
jgi:hypothetical protein